MKKFKNNLLLEKWINIILSVYNGENLNIKFKNQDNKLVDSESLKIITNQLKLLKLRNKKFQNITIKNIENITFMENIQEYIQDYS